MVVRAAIELRCGGQDLRESPYRFGREGNLLKMSLQQRHGAVYYDLVYRASSGVDSGIWWSSGIRDCPWNRDWVPESYCDA